MTPFLKSFSTFLAILLISAITIAALWLSNKPDTRENWYNQTVTKLTGKTFDKTFNPSEKPSIEEISDDSPLEHSKRHADPTYVCPMHPQIVKGEEGSCPICGMDLVEKEMAEEEPEEIVKKEKKILYWVAPMDANFRRDEPGQSPMGMDLVPVYNEDVDTSNDGFPRITINASTAQNMGIRLEKAAFKTLSRTIKTIGVISYNEDNLQHVHARADGWVEQLYAQSLGDLVKKGKPLLKYYSPDILAAQKDFLFAKRSSAALKKSSTIRLRDLHVPQYLINAISKTGNTQSRVPILAKQNGVVVKMGIKNGMYITPQTELYTLADLSSVWIIVDVFEHQLSWVKQGDKADIYVSSFPDKTWQGKVEYIYPELNPKTRTLKVRLKIDTPKQQLKPNMFANISLFTGDKKALTIPAEAIIYYENSPRIVKKIAENKYQPIEVKLGMKSNNQVEILEGLDEGDEVLVSGQFMIDSESNLQASFRRLLGK